MSTTGYLQMNCLRTVQRIWRGEETDEVPADKHTKGECGIHLAGVYGWKQGWNRKVSPSRWQTMEIRLYIFGRHFSSIQETDEENHIKKTGGAIKAMPDKVCVWLLFFWKFNLGMILQKRKRDTKNLVRKFSLKISEF